MAELNIKRPRFNKENQSDALRLVIVLQKQKPATTPPNLSAVVCGVIHQGDSVPLKSDSWRQSLNALCSKMNVVASNRTRMAGGLFNLSNQHHYSVIELSMKNYNESSFALMRPQFECFIRGVWGARCATEDQVKEFLKGNEPPRMKVMLSEIENIKEYEDGRLTKLKENIWSLFCNFTHGGGEQVSWQNSASSIGTAYTSKEVNIMRNYSDSIAYLNSAAFALLCEDEKIMKRITASYKRIFEENV
jgi:hypothetical protein